MYSLKCINLVKEFEGCVLTAYQDQAGIWTCGYGHTAEVFPNRVITQEIADNWLDDDLYTHCRQVLLVVHKPLTQGQLDALTSFCFNVGIGNLEESTLLRYLNDGQIEAAADQFLVWDKVHGVPNEGLLRRRQAEKALFLS